ncbi:SAM-dependent methyltransferase [Halobacteriales archaeon SW_7_71_33]|nr:MAG: SAM-dependent methyltransferase [Halobacteriales archaeon SW_7_71_33]
MNAADRGTVLDSARYLRGVRPVEPAELAGYVDAHPAVVRRVLRERAVGLALVERPDGAFVPVAESPVPGGIERVRRLPDHYDRRLADGLAAAYGPEWATGESGDRLRERVRRLKEDYYRDREVTYDGEAVHGYAVYHLPDFYAAVQYAVDIVAEAGLLPRRLRVLDVGAGVGGPALGLHDYLFGPPPADDGDPATDRPQDGTAALVDYHAVEPSDAADLLETLVEETGRNFHATVHRTTAEAFDPRTPPETDSGAGSGATDDGDDSDDAGWDLVLFANVLNELSTPVTTLRRYLSALAEDGTLLSLAPADRETSVGLRRVERAVVDGTAAGADGEATETDGPSPAEVTAFAPEGRLWPGRHPTDEGWSFDERPALDSTATQRRLDRPAGSEGEFRKTAVRFSYSALRLDGRERVRFVPDEDRLAPMARAETYVTDRVNAVGVKLSRSLSDGDANAVYRVGDGSQRVDHYAVLARETALNRALSRAAYGDPLLFENVLALYNDDEKGYNLVVDDETVVDRLPVG